MMKKKKITMISKNKKIMKKMEQKSRRIIKKMGNIHEITKEDKEEILN